MQVVANGKPRPVGEESTVKDLVTSLGLDPKYVIIELNGEPLERGRFDTSLEEGDRIEVVRAVAGG